jgi:PAS domain S-box-containing protein
MPLSFTFQTLVAAFIISLFLGALSFTFWFVHREDRTPLWMAAWLGASVVFTFCRLLQFAPLSEQMYLLIPRVLLTATFTMAWWGNGLSYSFISYRPRRVERLLILLLPILLMIILWGSNLILSQNTIVRRLAFSAVFTGVETGPLYLLASIVILILGIIPPLRLFQAKSPQQHESRLLAIGFIFVILFSLSDFLVTYLNLSWLRFSDYSYLVVSIIFSFIQVQRFGRLYSNMNIVVNERTAQLSQANETLFLSEVRYQLLFDHAPVGILLVNSQGEILNVNSSALQLLGSPSVEATKDINMFTFRSLIEAGISTDLKKCFETSEPVEGEYTYTTKWGKTIDAKVRFMPILNKMSSAHLVQLILDDTSEKVQHDKLQECLYAIARAAMTTETLEELFTKIHGLLKNFIPAQNFYIALYDSENDLLSFPYFLDTFDEAPPPEKPGRGLTEYVMRTQKPLLASKELFEELIQKREIELVGTDSVEWLGVPLIAQNQTIGVMTVQSYEESIRFSNKDLEVMAYVSTQVASAIERKRAVEDLRRRVDELTALYQTTLEIIHSQDLPDLLYSIVSTAVDLLDGTQGGMYLSDPQLKQTHCVVSYKNPSETIGKVFTYGEDAVGTVALTGQPLIIDNYRTWEDRVNRGDGNQPDQALISMPMLWRDQVTGVIQVIQDVENRKFTKEEINLLSSFANQAAIAVENWRLFSEIEQRAGELEASAKVAAALRVAESMNEMLPVLLKEAAEAVDAAVSSIFLRDTKSDHFVSKGWHPPDPNLIGLSHSPGDGINGYVARSGEIYMTENVNTDPKANILPGETSRLADIRGSISLPLYAYDEIIGVMNLGLHEERLFSSEEVSLLTSISNMAASAIHRSRLYDAANRRLKRLSSLHQIDQAITNNLDLHLTLNIVLTQILKQLEIDAAAVLLYQSELQILEYAAGEGFQTQVLQTSRLRLGQGYAGKAALERHTIQISDLSQHETGFLRSPNFRSEGFVAYIGIPLIAKGNIVGVLEIYNRKPFESNPEWMGFLEMLAGQAAIAIDNARLFEGLQHSNIQLKQAYEATIEGWALALELRDMETQGHSYRVVELSLELARKMGFNAEQLAHIRRGSLLHDIGKMGVPDAILQKPGPLTEQEWEIMRRHPVYAHQMLSSIPYLKPALDIPYYHHEKWDGSGYPRGLSGEQIPLAARIFAVVDVWDALNSDRPYRKAWPVEDVVTYLEEQSGKHFDPRVVQTFIEILQEKGYPAVKLDDLSLSLI